MKLTLQVTEIDKEPYQVTTTLAVVVAWERKFKRKASELANGNIGLEDLSFMAYEAAKASGMAVPPAFDGYLARLDDIDVVDNDTNPTHGAR